MKQYVIALAFAVGLSGLAAGRTANAASIEIVSPWARATPAGAKTGAAYMTIVNKGAVDDRLLSVSTPVAKTAQVHRTANENGIMKMLPVEGVDIKAGRQAILKPGGYHVMLMELNGPLVQGKSFPMTLTFEKSGTLEVSVTVQKIGSTGRQMEQMQHDMGGMNMN